jgi:hypothetical protein
MGGFKTRETGLNQCRRGKHVYPHPNKQAPSYYQVCTRCGEKIARRSRYKKGKETYGPHVKH